MFLRITRMENLSSAIIRDASSDISIRIEISFWRGEIFRLLRYDYEIDVWNKNFKSKRESYSLPFLLLRELD